MGKAITGLIGEFGERFQLVGRCLGTFLDLIKLFGVKIILLRSALQDYFYYFIESESVGCKINGMFVWFISIYNPSFKWAAFSFTYTLI